MRCTTRSDSSRAMLRWNTCRRLRIPPAQARSQRRPRDAVHAAGLVGHHRRRAPAAKKKAQLAHHVPAAHGFEPLRRAVAWLDLRRHLARRDVEHLRRLVALAHHILPRQHGALLEVPEHRLEVRARDARNSACVLASPAEGREHFVFAPLQPVIQIGEDADIGLPVAVEQSAARSAA